MVARCRKTLTREAQNSSRNRQTNEFDLVAVPAQGVVNHAFFDRSGCLRTSKVSDSLWSLSDRQVACSGVSVHCFAGRRQSHSFFGGFVCLLLGHDSGLSVKGHFSSMLCVHRAAKYSGERPVFQVDFQPEPGRQPFQVLIERSRTKSATKMNRIRLTMLLLSNVRGVFETKHRLSIFLENRVLSLETLVKGN